MSHRLIGSHEELIRYLEQMSGRQIRTREHVRSLMQEDWVPQADAERSRRRQSVKRAVLALLFTFAALQYYFLDVSLQILSLRELTHLTPTATNLVTSML